MDFTPVVNFFSHVPVDWIIICAIALIAGIDALRSGVGRVAALVLALPFASLLSISLPRAALIGSAASSLSTALQAALFTALLAVTYLLVRRITSSYEGSSGAMQALAAGIASVFLFVMWIQLPVFQSVWHFGQQANAVFGEAYRFWWTIGSLALLSFSRS